VDGFSRLFLPPTTPPNPNDGSLAISLNEQSSWIIQLTQNILNALDTIKVAKPSLFIDGLDFVLAAGETNITANDILTLLANLSEVLSIL
jgi:hypothetical protein